MHIITKPREEAITVKFKDKLYEVRLDSDGAHVPEDLGQFMCQKGLVAKGYRDDPKPRWAVNSDGSHGELIPRYSPWVKDVTENTK